MARGMANGEPIVSQANTREFGDGYSRTFGDKPIERGRWVWDETRRELVRAEDYRAPPLAVDAPILSGRFYEGMTTLEGDDIGSRAKYRRYCQEKGVTNMSDFSDKWYADLKSSREREAKRSRREKVARAVYTKFKP